MYLGSYVLSNQFDGEGEGGVVGNWHESPCNVFLWPVQASYREGKWMGIEEWAMDEAGSNIWKEKHKWMSEEGKWMMWRDTWVR